MRRDLLLVMASDPAALFSAVQQAAVVEHQLSYTVNTLWKSLTSYNLILRLFR